MNWKGVPPSDWHSEEGSAEERERLNDVERRLQAARLNPIQLTAAAWERIISASENPGMPEPEMMAPACRARPSRRRWPHGPIGKIAAIWLSGVIVGSGGMFLMMSRGPDIAQTDDSQPPTALLPRNPIPRNLEPSSVAPETESKSMPRPGEPGIDAATAKVAHSGPAESLRGTEADEAHTARIVNSIHELRWAAWLDAPVLGPKVTLGPFGKELLKSPPSGIFPLRLRASETPPREERLQQSDSQRELASSFVPPPGATPRRIWEELRMDRVALGRPL